MNLFKMLDAVLALVAIVAVARAVGDIRHYRGSLNRHRLGRSLAATVIILSIVVVAFIGGRAYENKLAADAGFSNVDAYRASLLKKSNVDAQKTEESALAESKPRDCGDDVQCYAEESEIEASAQCGKEIERLAKYQSKWLTGWTTPTFSRVKWKNQNARVITFVGDKIQFQNGFGAWQQYIYFCDFDIRSKQVTSVRAEPGRL
jgi:hypothetical protein